MNMNKITKSFLLGALMASSLCSFAEVKVIAHRGFWTSEGSAQNSIASLKKAAQAKVYGSEFDVQMTLDGQIVVNHDDSIQGVCIADVPYSQIRDMRLNNGEMIPTLDSYLKVGKTLPDIQLILEIKPHKTKELEDQAVKKIVAKVKKMGMEKQVQYISFSLNICEQLARLSPKSEIAYLNGEKSPTELKAKGINGIDYHYKVMTKKPEWIQESHDNGMKVNVWTVNDLEKAKQLIDQKVDYITTDRPLEIKKLIDK